ncbi:MAG: isoprenylcysteine carboxylmethyltransferase family protein [Gammaproteobacteria bacterium]|nr:isoprenylcysteine carboxylmethyltransferase family protein [Gammaproteobacteria bacterium]
MSSVMIIVFFSVAVVGRSIMQYRLTGDHGMRPANHESSFIVIFSNILITIVFIGVISLSIISTFVGFEADFQFGTYGELAGVILCLSGVFITSISQIQMGKEWRIGVDNKEKTKLVTHGIYSKIRNPIYTGVMIFGLGLLALEPSLFMLLFAILGYIAIEVHVRNVEEPHLRKLHGKKFSDYENSTGRYFPKMKNN